MIDYHYEDQLDVLARLHEGIRWTDVEKSLRANPEAMRKLQALDEKGHNMNVFGEENGEFVFASAWDNYEQVAEDHRNVVFDKEVQELLTRSSLGERCNGNAVDIARVLGVDLADPKFHEQLRKAIAVNGWAWLKTDAATRKTGDALCGFRDGINRNLAVNHNVFSSFRAALRVKKA